MAEFNFEETFNAEEYLYFYDSFLTKEKLKEEIEFLIRFTALERPLKILDLACGHGRHANALAELGHDVTGIDINDGFLAIAKQNGIGLSHPPRYLRQDMRDLKNKEAYDRVYVLYTAFGYFDDDENRKVLRNIFDSLKPGGKFCFDTHNRDTFMTYYQPCSVVERDGNFMIDQRIFNSLSGRCETKRTVIYKGNQKSFPFFVRFYNPTEITEILSPIGFSRIEFYEDWQGKGLTQNCKRMIVLAEKYA